MTGPPSTIKQMQSSSLFSSITSWEVATSGPYHAEHARSLPKVQEIVRSTDKDVANFFNSYEQDLTLLAMNIYSPADDPIPTMTLLEDIVDEILYAVSRGSDINNRVVSHLETKVSERCQIISCGVTRWQDELYTRLKSANGIDATMAPILQQHAQPIPSLQPTTPGKSKLAIVGMAGRFPDSANHEKLWELLYGGIDSHRNVSNSLRSVLSYQNG